MKKIYLTFFILASFLCLHAQTFHKYYTNTGSIGTLYRCLQTSDGGYASVGSVTNTISFDNDFLLVKTDANGNLSWSRRIPYLGSEEFTDIIETSGGGLVVVGGSVNTTSFASEAVVIKYDASGTLLWSNSYVAANSSSIAKAVEKDSLGNLYVMGSVSVAAAPTDYFIMKLDATGNITQQSYFGTAEPDLPLAFVRNPATGDMYISGWHNDGSGENIHLLKISSAMTMTWDLQIGGTIKYFCYDIKLKANGNLVLAGRYDDTLSPYRVFIAEINPAGAQVWANDYSPLDSLRCYAYGLTVDGNNLGVTGIVEDSVRGTLAFQVDNIGNINWTERIGAATGEYASGYGINTTSDGGYIVCGNRGDNTGSNSIVQLIKLTSTGVSACNFSTYPIVPSSVTLPALNFLINTTAGAMISQNITLSPSALSGTGDACPVGIDEAGASGVFAVYPNPAGEEVSLLRKSPESGTLVLFNIMGEQIMQREIMTGEREITLNVKDMSDGIYFIRLNAGKNSFMQKLVVE